MKALAAAWKSLGALLLFVLGGFAVDAWRRRGEREQGLAREAAAAQDAAKQKEAREREEAEGLQAQARHSEAVRRAEEERAATVARDPTDVFNEIDASRQKRGL